MEFLRALKSESRKLLYNKITVIATTLIIILFMYFLGWMMSNWVGIHIYPINKIYYNNVQTLTAEYEEAERGYAAALEAESSGQLTNADPDYYLEEMHRIQFVLDNDYPEVSFLSEENAWYGDTGGSNYFSPRTAGSWVMTFIGWYGYILIGVFSLAMCCLFLIRPNVGSESKNYRAAPVSWFKLNLARVTLAVILSVIFWLGVVAWGLIESINSIPVFVMSTGTFTAIPLWSIFMQRMACFLPIIFGIAALALAVVCCVYTTKKYLVAD